MSLHKRVYKVLVTEYYQGYISVNAETPEQALRQAQQMYKSGILQPVKTAWSFSTLRPGTELLVVELAEDRNGCEVMTEHPPEPKIGRGNTLDKAQCQV